MKRFEDTGSHQWWSSPGNIMSLSSAPSCVGVEVDLIAAAMFHRTMIVGESLIICHMYA